MKYLVGILVGIGATILVVFLFLTQKNLPLPLANNPVSTATPVSSPQDSNAPIDNRAPSGGSGADTGTISGKLCYPSQFLPAGTIEAKNTLNGTIVSQAYEGSENGASSSFSIAVPAGTYILRYAAKPDPNSDPLYGYTTDVCTTGLETTCAQDNARQHNQFIVPSGGTIINVNLCDFYYSETTNPGF